MHPYDVTEAAWLKRMRDYAKNGYAFDLEENEDRIRCVAAPVRDATGKIKAAISVSSAAHYMNDAAHAGADQTMCAGRPNRSAANWAGVTLP